MNQWQFDTFKTFSTNHVSLGAGLPVWLTHGESAVLHKLISTLCLIIICHNYDFSSHNVDCHHTLSQLLLSVSILTFLTFSKFMSSFLFVSLFDFWSHIFDISWQFWPSQLIFYLIIYTFMSLLWLSHYYNFYFIISIFVIISTFYLNYCLVCQFLLFISFMTMTVFDFFYLIYHNYDFIS